MGHGVSRAYTAHSVKRLFLLASAAVLVAAALTTTGAPAAAPGSPRVLAIHFTSDVNPVTQSWLNSELNRAQKQGYSAAVIVLDTPGGLEDSMRKIVQKELSLSIPVIVYVSPGGARAAEPFLGLHPGRVPRAVVVAERFDSGGEDLDAPAGGVERMCSGVLTEVGEQG